MMMSNNISFGGEIYVFDIEAIISFINKSNNKKISETEITEDFKLEKNSPVLVNKTIKEVTAPMASDIDNIRYDLVKMFVISLINNEEEYGSMPYGINMAFNTLLSLGLIKKMNYEEE